MQTREYRTQDKSTWGPGPWQAEPDKRQWADSETGYPCLILRNHFGAWCGYAGVPPSHPAYGKGYDDLDVDVHGGLTFADHCQTDVPEEKAICHVPDPGEADDVWWLGFDTSHGYDYQPAHAVYLKSQGLRDASYGPFGIECRYRTQAYVEAEVTHLARQLKNLEEQP